MTTPRNVRERAADGTGARREVRVGVAALAVARGSGLLVTLGLGSCVAIVLWDEAARVGGLAHVLLPGPELSRDASNPAKFPCTAVPLLVRQMRAAGAGDRLTARLVGGASRGDNELRGLRRRKMARSGNRAARADGAGP